MRVVPTRALGAVNRFPAAAVTHAQQAPEPIRAVPQAAIPEQAVAAIPPRSIRRVLAAADLHNIR